MLRGDVLAMLPALPVVREAIADTGVGFVRRANADGHDYFFANLTAVPIERWVTLGIGAASAALLDPLTSTGGAAALRHTGKQTEVYLQLAPGESIDPADHAACASAGDAVVVHRDRGPSARAHR